LFTHNPVVSLLSRHLPVLLVAAFIKRLSRLSLAAPPAAIVSIVPFVYNLLKRHPSCLILIHRPEEFDTEDSAAAAAANSDPYDFTEADPLKAHALDSSLWELASLRNHYLASVSTLAKVFGEQMTKPKYDLEDFLDHAYATVCCSAPYLPPLTVFYLVDVLYPLAL
jgi:U3 small nucleolar RNA-associated protein 19